LLKSRPPLPAPPVSQIPILHVVAPEPSWCFISTLVS